MKVAIVTRTKDRPIFLQRAIISVSTQTYRDYCHVIINDGGSSLDVERIVSSFDESIKNKIKLFHRKESSNAPDSIFNESIDRVESDFFAIHDDDDTWHEDFLATTASKLEQNVNLGAVVVKTDKVIEIVKGDKIVEKKRFSWMPDLITINLYRQCIDNQFTPISTLFRRSAYESVGKFDETLPVVGDWEFGVRLLKEYDVEFINTVEPLAFYHHRKKIGTPQDSISSNEKHRYYTNQVMNRYLREELNNGHLGVGFMMSQLKYNQDFTYGLIKRIMPDRLVRLMKRYK